MGPRRRASEEQDQAVASHQFHLWSILCAGDIDREGLIDAWHCPGTRAILEETIRSTAAVLSGRRSYKDEEDRAITPLAGGTRSAVLGALDAAGGRNVLVIGADVARQCIQEGLIDEMVIHFAPVLLGDGVRFFSCPGLVDGVRLEATEVRQSGRLVSLRFLVVR